MIRLELRSHTLVAVCRVQWTHVRFPFWYFCCQVWLANLRYTWRMVKISHSDIHAHSYSVVALVYRCLWRRHLLYVWATLLLLCPILCEGSSQMQKINLAFTPSIQSGMCLAQMGCIIHPASSGCIEGPFLCWIHLIYPHGEPFRDRLIRCLIHIKWFPSVWSLNSCTPSFSFSPCLSSHTFSKETHFSHISWIWITYRAGVKGMGCKIYCLVIWFLQIQTVGSNMDWNNVSSENNVDKRNLPLFDYMHLTANVPAILQTGFNQRN